MPPTITSLSPSSGVVGTHFNISGNGLIAYPPGTAPSVTFNGIAATVLSYNVSNISTLVPVGGTTGQVFVTVPGSGTSNGLTFTVTSGGPAPTITSLTPNTGPTGTSVIVAGANYGAMQGTSTVRVNGITAAVTSWSATSITIRIPSTATTGPVIVTVGGVASNSSVFTVTTPSIGGMAGPLNLFLIPAQTGGLPLIWVFDPTNFNDPNNASIYNYKVEDIIAGRTPSCSRAIITVRDLGVATIILTLSGIDQNTQAPISSMTTLPIGTVAATGALITYLPGLELTAQNLQLSIIRSPGAGPVSIVKVRLEGRVEMTAYA